MNQWRFDQLKYAVGISTLFSFYGIVSFIVWFMGEKMNYGVQPRVVTIVLLLITLPIALLVGFVVTRRSRKKAEAEKAAKEAEKNPDATPAKVATPKGNDEISQAAEETVQFLKGSNLGGGKDAVYELPWYLVIGTPKSGKTSLSLASNLNFQTLPSQRQSEQKLIRPTRNIDWRVTSEAVLLDTAGRYQTEGSDEEEWANLLDTLKKYRGNRPLDGMILGISAERILHADDSDIEQMAKVLRTRIDEVIQRTKIRFPIYLVFTHADSIEGFRDSFSVSQKEGQNLVWGATIPLEKSENAHAMFDAEFDLLQNSIMKRRLMRLSAPFPPVRQLKIFNFPLHFGSARKKLGHFVTTLFKANPFSESPFLRGFYFTAVPVNRPKIDGSQTMTNVGQTVGQSFFTEKLFRDVILRDKDLVATFQSQKVSPPIMGWLFTFLMAIVTVSLLAFSAFSLYRNKVTIDEATRRGESVLTMVKADKDRNPLAKNPEETRAEIDKIENLRKSLVDLDKAERDNFTFLKYIGLYSANRLYREKLLPIYYNAVEQRFKKPVVKKIEDELRKFSQSPAANSTQLTPEQELELGKKYDLLKAYLMLSGQYKEQSEPTFLADALKEFWKTESKTPEGMEKTVEEILNFYAKQTDRLPKTEGDPSAFPRINLDETNTKSLIETARKKLQAFPAWARYYKGAVTRISKKIDAVNADSILAGRSAGVLESSFSVPGAYTIEAYRTDMREAIDKATEELTKDDWVMGEKSEKAQAQGDDFKKIEDKYLNDYADYWRKFIQSVKVVDYKTDKNIATDALKAFSNAESPMKLLLQEVSKQTNLSKEPEAKGWIDWFFSLFKPKKDKKNTSDTIVEKEFRPLFAFTDGSDKSDQSPISQYGADLKRIGDELETKGVDEIKTISQELANPNSKSKFGALMNSVEKGINTKTEGFQATAAGKDIATLLKKPFANLKAFFGADEKTQIQKTWETEILSKAKETEKGFPFDNEGEADLTKLTAYLNPQNGTFSKFYDDRLKKFFTEENGQLRVKEGATVVFTDEFIKYLNSTLKLREALYGKGATPSFKYSVTLQKVTDGTVELTIDGQKLDSTGTGSQDFTFPAAAGETGAFMNFSSTSEPTSTSGTTPSLSPSPSGSPAASPAPTNKFQNSSPTPSSSSATQIKEPGPWGLFKFLQKGNPQKNGTDYVANYKLGSKTITVTFKPTGGDLFDRNVFTSSRAPQAIFKP